MVAYEKVWIFMCTYVESIDLEPEMMGRISEYSIWPIYQCYFGEDDWLSLCNMFAV